jgi:hypothetical protein
MRGRAALAALVLAAAALLVAGSPAAPTSYPAPSGAIALDGLDLHDGTVYEDASTYFMVGSEYGCGFAWYVASPWCGFGVATAPSLAGPWTDPQPLFPPTETDPLTHVTFASECATTDGHGCFNPRMAARPDGVWVLWWNEVNGRTSTTTSAYWIMGCNGPAGPCGASAGAPHGSTHKPTLHQCAGNNGDFALTPDGAGGAAIICSYGGTPAIEHLDNSWANGNGSGANGLAGLAGVEGIGAWQAADGTWVMTYAERCGYCTGTPTGYATAPSLLGPWAAPANLGWSAPAGGRRDFSLGCGGQARTVAVVDGQPWQWTDLWQGLRGEPGAGVLLSPLSYQPADGAPGDGAVWVPPVSYPCV